MKSMSYLVANSRKNSVADLVIYFLATMTNDDNGNMK